MPDQTNKFAETSTNVTSLPMEVVLKILSVLTLWDHFLVENALKDLLVINRLAAVLILDPVLMELFVMEMPSVLSGEDSQDTSVE